MAKSLAVLLYHPMRTILRFLLRLMYRIELRGWENLNTGNQRAVIVANHVSYLDAVLVAAFLPNRTVFAINTHQARKWWIRLFLNFVDAFPVDPANPLSTKSLIRKVQEGRPCMIFPEGRLTMTGALMKVYDGPGLVADKADAVLVPVRIDGAEQTPFSHMRGKTKLRWFPKIILTAMPATKLAVAAEIKGRARRRILGEQLYDILSNMMYATGDRHRTLFGTMLDAASTYGKHTMVLEDATRQVIDFDKLILGALVLGRQFAKATKPGDNVGVLLPNVNATAVTFMGLQAYRRIPAMLNFTAGEANLVIACRTAQARTVVTSRQFIEKGHLETVVAALEKEVQVLYLEDIRARITVADKLSGLATRPFVRRWYRKWQVTPDSPAVILFTSGSEGTPKGVVLSHANIVANCQQLAARIDFNQKDSVFNALPVFHAFGLTGGLLLPLLNGIRSFLYPSPLHYRIVPELTYDANATILFGTDTFLSGYARAGAPYDFYSVRYVFAGAEKVRDETRRAFMDKFGLRILEGYGATETAPVLAMNTPMHYRSGTVGRILPGIETRLEPVEGVSEGGRLSVRGPNVMLGYLRAEKPGVLQPPESGWYDTGDIVTIEEGGFVRIQGRAKRFAKIAGEMVSLGRIEAELDQLWPDNVHAVVSVPDDRKGEQLVVLSEKKDATREAIQTRFRERGLPELYIPRRVTMVEKIPLLGTGKVDYRAVAELATAPV